MLSKSNILKLALFATGLSGIVAEYILSTLATYFLGNSVLQWTMILSIMLFSMGLGSRISKYFETHLLEKFILIEFILSLLVSFCSVLAYAVSIYASFNEDLSYYTFELDGVAIYFMSILIGLLIGMEIPLVTRLNEDYETLRVNISNVMEKDYYGSLLGGVFFAFIGLPYLGLTYTPFILGIVNFIVAVGLYFRLQNLVDKKYNFSIKLGTICVFLVIATGAVFAKNVVEYGEQKRYKDKVIFQDQSPFQKIVVTQWKEFYWLYLNGNPQLSTFDEWLYHEPLVHPVMKLSQNPKNILVLGGGDGCAVREILKYESVESVTLIDLDAKVTQLCSTHPIFTELNKNSLSHDKVTVRNEDAFTFLQQGTDFFDVMIIDFPDPKTIELSRLFSKEFYRMCHQHLRPNGIMIVQSGSPYYATKAFNCIEKTIDEAGFSVIPIHNQVLTLGEWGWVIGAKSIKQENLKPMLHSLDFQDIKTRWINNEAMQLITSFGKNLIQIDSSQIESNTIHNPVLPEYYRNGNWDLY
ncbi:MAG: polyamine aminopropyltransferase [Flammeovirgaceae bacterium]|nr:polyamine aminopropyltransferase [Flammeovirgaceae bacterium]